MTDNIFESLPPPSSQQQELPNSSNPNESKDESRSPAPTLVLKSSLKRSKPAESAPDVSEPEGNICYVGGLRFSRPRKLKEYTNYVADLENGAANWCGDGSVDLKDVATDVIMLSFRTSKGLELKGVWRREVMSDEFKKLVGNDEVKIEDHVRYLRRWDSVLSQVSQLKLHRNKLEDLYEQNEIGLSLNGENDRKNIALSLNGEKERRVSVLCQW
ncbi:hypothetical protein DY000_02051084 [Brassica cretica]|uniref:Uncharacterized protein n=1 Tax=Brassica cretica TaxID=69181 RepID=A0ABQ7EPF3_BRACR|nr:hypothetical protein DY000_02051084 [Brassica cretica]